jgi:hypothetical protein
MASPSDVISQLAATRAAATASTSQCNALIDEQTNSGAPDPTVMSNCVLTIGQNDTIIQNCDQHIVAAILARSDVDTWLASLNSLTTQMAAQSAALTTDIDDLNALKSYATAIAGMLSHI